MRDACRRADVEHVGAHRLRDALASELLREDASLLEISPVLRHKDLETTAIYALCAAAHNLYVADCELATRKQMSDIHARGGRFVSVLPRSRGEDAQIRAWAQSHAFGSIVDVSAWGRYS